MDNEKKKPEYIFMFEVVYGLFGYRTFGMR